MEIVIDTSAILAVLLNESAKDQILSKTVGCTLISPFSIDAEIGNAFSAMFKRKRISFEMAFEAIKQFEIIPIRKMNLDLTESLKLCVEKNIYAYDAYMLQCSLTFSKPLLSLD